jgi:phosphinothricin acetyltransferase
MYCLVFGAAILVEDIYRTVMEAISVIDCGPEHIESILQIINHAIVHTTSVYDYRPRTASTIRQWMSDRSGQGHPILGACDERGLLVGFGSYGVFRPWPAYKYTVEHSLYVDPGHKRRGIGRRLLQALIDRARGQGYHAMIAGIDAANRPSIALHVSMGFAHAGTLREVGFKFGSWRDLVFYQLLLETPASPEDG